MRKEIELKFQMTPRDLRKLRTARVLRRKPLTEENLVSVYFDTPKHKLARNDVTLRVRHNGHNRLQTIKSGGLASSFRRGEWEHEIKRDVPNLRKARDTALEPLLTKKLKRRLKPVFETHIHRTSVPVRKNGTRIEVALDEGQVRAGQRSAPISELELELKRGKPGDIFKLAHEMGKLTPVTLSLKSKSERGYDLIENKPAKAVGAEKIRFQRGMNTADAFRIIGRSICGTSLPTKPR
jgi:inorganic triphosphatase YgiF